MTAADAHGHDVDGEIVRTRGQTLFISQTNDDNAEGFDVTIPDGWGGEYEVYVTWPTSQQTESCSPEHTAFAMAWGAAF